jgi:thiol-disulfide isomerase/thioredoxin
VRVLATLLVALTTGAAALAAAPAAALDLRLARRDGPPTTLRELVGDRPAVVAFWATWCAPCRAEVPALNRAAERWRDRGLRVVGVALEADDARVRAAAEEWGIRYDVQTITGDDVERTETVFPRGLPATAFVRDGTATLHERLLDDATLDRLVPPLLEPAAPAH